MAVTGTDYSSFLRTGHPYKLNEVKNGQMPTYPFSDITGALGMVTDNDAEPGDPNPGTDNTLPTPTSYADVSYVIGGFGWKARWVDLAGYILTGTATQFNLETGGMSAYNNNQVDKKYDCGLCHTTGWKDYTSQPGDTRNLNRQNNLPGMEGTFYAAGVQCEACHGAGSFHVAAPGAGNITRVARARKTADLTAADMAYGKPVACSECHTRDGEKLYPTYTPAGNRIKASGGLIQHHEQYDEMRGINPDNVAAGAKGPHAPLLCVACHNAHTTTVYMGVSGDSPGMNKHCTVCHNATGIGGKAYPPTNDMAGLVDCLDCHMPQMVKSAVSHAAVGTGPVTGDIRTHIFKIDLTTTTQYTGTGAYSYPWITGAWACKTCHNNVVEYDLGFPSAISIHGGPPPGPNARRGGLLYDKWWVVNGAPSPTGNHPLYPPVGTKTGSTTYRCKECHGWDYIGKDGRYESGSNYTGIKGVLDAVTTMTEAEIFAIVKNPNGDGTGGTTVNGHNFGAYGLSDGDINDLVAFIKNGGVIDPWPYINRAGSPGSYTYSFNGNAVAGASLYSGGVNPAVDCSMCHGPDGTAIAFGGVEFVGTLANDNPQETFHKIRFGHAGSRMTSYYQLGMTSAQGADVGAYCATLPQ
jgi:mono/diheme cytochrome c family protein